MHRTIVWAILFLVTLALATFTASHCCLSSLYLLQDDGQIEASGINAKRVDGSSVDWLRHSPSELPHRRLAGFNRKVLNQQYADPRTVQLRNPQPLPDQEYKVNPLIKPKGYPWHRWASTSSGSYPLNVQKFVSILSKLGRGENELGTLHPKDYVSNNALLTPDTIRLHGSVQVFLIRNATVLRSKGVTGAFVSLLQNAMDKARQYVDVEPGLKLLTQGDFPLIYDSNDYPWCGDDLVPIFRLNAIKDISCQHSWPVLSLTYFNDANVQLLASPYQWDTTMKKWDEAYPWSSKISKVVWRGRMTGYTHQDGERPRQKLVEYAQSFGELMDVQVSNKSNRIDQDDFQRYMAILDVDGNAWSARFGKLLCYNSVVIKVEPTYAGYWEKEVEPWVHYIPVKADFSNLLETVKYVTNSANADHVAWIIKNAQSFCRTKLTIEQYTVDILWTLLAYTELLAKSPDFYQNWRSNIDAYEMTSLKMKAWSGDGPESVFKHLMNSAGDS